MDSIRLQSEEFGGDYSALFGFMGFQDVREEARDKFVPVLPHHERFVVGVKDDANFPTGNPVVVGVTFKVEVVEATFFAVGVGVTV
jgi:hypothetical protein